MNTVYLETSAVLAWLFGESTAATAQQAMEAADTLVTSSLTLLESERALLRHHLQQATSEAAFRQSLGILRRWATSWHVLEVSRAVRVRAAARFPVEPVRALDAIHLATALAFSEAYADVGVLSFDRRVVTNIGELGLRVVAA